MAHRGLTFGIFLAPFHRLGENPSLAIESVVELIQWLDLLGYDEAWVGEHHSAGWELIASPELVIAAAAEKTKYIKLGSGVTKTCRCHHPFLVAQRLPGAARSYDPRRRPRAMLGVWAGGADLRCVYAGDRTIDATAADAAVDGRDHAPAGDGRPRHHEDRLVRDE